MSATGRGAERAELDRYDTPPELAAELVGLLDLPPGAVVLEPAAGGGAFVEPLIAGLWSTKGLVFALDIDSEAAEELKGTRGVQVSHADFLCWPRDHGYDAIVGNPPYGDAEAFVRRALRLVKPGGLVAFLLRVGFLVGRGRSPLWLAHRPERVHLVVERPSFTGGGTDSASYAWCVWRRGYRGPTELAWLSWCLDPDARRTPRKGANPNQLELEPSSALPEVP